MIVDIADGAGLVVQGLAGVMPTAVDISLATNVVGGDHLR